MMSLIAKVLSPTLVLIIALLSQTANAFDVIGAPVEISGVKLVKQTRISRTVFEYTYKINIANSREPLSGVVAKINSTPPQIKIIDDTVNLGDLPGYAQGVSNDTFSIRLDRSVAFDPATLTWVVVADGTSNSCNITPAITSPITTTQLVQPVSAPTGNPVFVYGSGFTTCSRVFLGNKEVENTEIVSDQELRIIVPFDFNSQNQLIPLATGSYPIKVDSGSAVNFTVTELPGNPNPAGQLLNEYIYTSFQFLAQSLTDFQSALPQLLQETQNQPNTQKFVQTLANLANNLNNQGEATTNQLIGIVDSLTLDTLERAIYYRQTLLDINQQPIITALSITKNQKNNQQNKVASQMQRLSNVTNATNCADIIDGNQWLECRYNDVQLVKKVANNSGVFGSCAFVTGALGSVTGGATLPIAGVCGIASTLGFISSTIHEINIATNTGIIKGFQLHIAGTNADVVDQKNMPIDLFLNNYDNNENISLQTSKAKYITHATLTISKQPEWIKILNGILSELLTVGKIDSGIPLVDYLASTLRDMASNKINNDVNAPTISKQINPNKIKSTLSWLGGGECNIADAKSIYLQTTAEYKWVVPDVATNPSPGQFMHAPAVCNYSVEDYYRLPSEDSIKSTIDFSVKRYPSLTVNVIDTDSSVTYGKTPLSNHSKCNNGSSPCIEYFDLKQGEESLFYLNAEPSNGKVASWGLNGSDICIGKTKCIVPLNFGNNPGVNVTFKAYIPIFDVQRNRLDSQEGSPLVAEFTCGSRYETYELNCTGNIEDDLPEKFQIEMLLGKSTVQFNIPYNGVPTFDFPFSGSFNSNSGKIKAVSQHILQGTNKSVCAGDITWSEETEFEIDATLKEDGTLTGTSNEIVTKSWSPNPGQSLICKYINSITAKPIKQP